MTEPVSNHLKRYNLLIGEIDSVYHEFSLSLGLCDSVSMVLYALYTNGGHCLLKDICRLSGRSKQTINSAVRSLEKEKLIALENVNGKNKLVKLTEDGKKFSENTVSKIVKAENEIFDGWSAEDKEKYLMLTERYLDALEAKSKKIKEEKQ